MITEFILGGSIITLATSFQGIVKPAIAWSFPVDAILVYWLLRHRPGLGIEMMKASLSILSFTVAVFIALKKIQLIPALVVGLIAWIVTNVII